MIIIQENRKDDREEGFAFRCYKCASIFVASKSEVLIHTIRSNTIVSISCPCCDKIIKNSVEQTKLYLKILRDARPELKLGEKFK